MSICLIHVFKRTSKDFFVTLMVPESDGSYRKSLAQTGKVWIWFHVSCVLLHYLVLKLGYFITVYKIFCNQIWFTLFVPNSSSSSLKWPNLINGDLSLLEDLENYCWRKLNKLNFFTYLNFYQVSGDQGYACSIKVVTYFISIMSASGKASTCTT